MRRALAFALVLLPFPVGAQEQPAGMEAPLTVSPEIEAGMLREQLLASQQRIAELEQALANTQAVAVQVPELQAKNARLVAAGQELIGSYARRYGQSQWGPFQLARTRFERELQALGDRLHENRADVPATPAASGDSQ